MGEINMYSIDEIMDMLDWHKPPEIQKKGRELAKEIKCINVFLQPGHPEYNKNVWDNCAAILAARTDEELRPYLYELFCWVLDLNWPGADCIYDRLKEYKDKEWFDCILNICINEAKALGEDIWLDVLLEIKERKRPYGPLKLVEMHK